MAGMACGAAGPMRAQRGCR